MPSSIDGEYDAGDLSGPPIFEKPATKSAFFAENDGWFGEFTGLPKNDFREIGDYGLRLSLA